MPAPAGSFVSEWYVVCFCKERQEVSGNGAAARSADAYRRGWVYTKHVGWICPFHVEHGVDATKGCPIPVARHRLTQKCPGKGCGAPASQLKKLTVPGEVFRCTCCGREWEAIHA